MKAVAKGSAFGKTSCQATQGALAEMLHTVPILCALVAVANGHVVWIFPPARPIALDFLDTVRRQPPCGVPKPGDFVRALYDFSIVCTEYPTLDPNRVLVTGREYTFIWRMSYAHDGGFRLNLLDDYGKYMQTLVATNSTWASADNK